MAKKLRNSRAWIWWPKKLPNVEVPDVPISDLGGWFVGKIMWMNKRMNKFRVYFAEDDSEDYIGEDKINGMDIIILAWVYLCFCS